jgi:molybdenum cofactor cytidylyltransferase
MISAIILAAGLSSRMGRNKLLLPIGKQSVIEHVVEAVSKSHVDEIIVVLGKDAEDIGAVLEGFEIKIVLNSDYEKGQSSSVKAGIKTINNHAEGALFFMGDQPMIKVKLINDIIDEFNKGQSSIVVPTYKNKRGNPVLFSRCWFTELNQVQGDKGGREILNNNLDQVQFIEISDELFFQDVDTEWMYKQLKVDLKKV